MLNFPPPFFGLNFKNHEWSCSVGGVFYNVLCPNDPCPSSLSCRSQDIQTVLSSVTGSLGVDPSSEPQRFQNSSILMGHDGLFWLFLNFSWP